ncbi:MAG: acyltransferase [Oscillospiraceae bacterium]|nr:acyltransferase [Oscillospiraceae bacterium]
MTKDKISPLTGSSRKTNLELYRIIMMLFIVMYHYVANSGLISSDGPIYSDISAKRSVLLLILGAWGKGAINGFVLITGYFMCKKNIGAKKFAMLFCETMFYRITINLIFFLTGKTAFTADNLLTALLPVRYISDSLSQIYLVFFLSIPFLNILINNLSEKMHLRLLMLSGFVYIFFGSFSKLGVRFNYFSWFIVIYLIGAYIGCYQKKIFNNRKLWGYLMLFSLGLSLATVINGINGKTNAYKYLSEVNKLLPVTNGITTFLFFKNVNLKHSSFINSVAASSYGVLLIHTCGDTMRKWLWKDLLNVTKSFYLPWPLLLIHIFASVFGIYIICTVIDMLRKRFLEKPLFSIWDKKFPEFKKKYLGFEQRLCRRFNISDEA